LPVVDFFRNTFGTARLKKAVARVGQPPRDPYMLLGLYVVVETAKRAKTLDTKTASNLIAKLGGYPRMRDTIKPLERKVYDTGSTIRALHRDAKNLLIQEEYARSVTSGIEMRMDGWRKSGLSYDTWERRNLLKMRSKPSC
jgi:hypothetical protein